MPVSEKRLRAIGLKARILADKRRRRRLGQPSPYVELMLSAYERTGSVSDFFHLHHFSSMSPPDVPSSDQRRFRRRLATKKFYSSLASAIRKRFLSLSPPPKPNRALQNPDLAGDGLKRCSSCKETKGLGSFCRDRSSRDGLCHRCRTCNSSHVRRYSYASGLRHGRHYGGCINRAAIYERDGGICHICGGEVSFDEMHIDHLIPLSRGGAHSPENVACSHDFCNLSKGNKTVDEMGVWAMCPSPRN